MEEWDIIGFLIAGPQLLDPEWIWGKCLTLHLSKKKKKEKRKKLVSCDYMAGVFHGHYFLFQLNFIIFQAKKRQKHFIKKNIFLVMRTLYHLELSPCDREILIQIVPSTLTKTIVHVIGKFLYKTKHHDRGWLAQIIWFWCFYKLNKVNLLHKMGIVWF